MSGQTIFFFLLIVITVLTLVVLYQRFAFRRGIQTKLIQISRKLEEILKSDSDEKVMVFTDEPVLMELTGEINRLLLDRQKVKAEFRRGEIASKKMLANISHDIKTPLTVILGYLEIMRLTGADDEMLKKVEAKAKQVVDLINQFFTLAKLEAGDANITISRINVSEICRESALGFYAVRYGSDGKYLGIFLHEEKNGVSIDVTDRGKGIQKEFADRIFERLYTMEDSRNREVQGNGLGLTIAKNLAVQLGGDLCVESIPGIRTTFTVRLKKINY